MHLQKERARSDAKAEKKVCKKSDSIWSQGACPSGYYQCLVAMNEESAAFAGTPDEAFSILTDILPPFFAIQCPARS